MEDDNVISKPGRAGKREIISEINEKINFFKNINNFIIASFSFFKSFADNAESKDFVLVKEYLKI